MNNRNSNIKRAVILFTLSPEKDAREKFKRVDLRKSKNLFAGLLDNSLSTIQKAGQKVNFDLFVASDESSIDNYLNSRNQLKYTKLHQRGDDFHERFVNAYAEVYNLDYDEIVIIGNDWPELNSDIITSAFSQLEARDAVIGPSRDGGFYLLGLCKYSASLFNNIKWRSSSVFVSLQTNLEKHNFACYQLPLLQDIDSINDIRYFLSKSELFLHPIIFLVTSFFTDSSKKINERYFHKAFPQLNLTEQQLPPPNYSLY